MVRAVLHLENSAIRTALVLCLALCLSVWPAASALTAEPQAGVYTGKLNPDLVPTHVLGLERSMKPASEAERELLPTAPDGKVFIGALKVWTSKGLRLAFIRPKGGSPYIYADTDSNEKFEESERHALSPLPARPDVEGAVVLYRDLEQGPFSRIPVRIAIMKSEDTEDRATPATSMEMVFAEGTVDIEGREILVSYLFDKKKGTVNPEHGWIGMDCNSDGTIDRGFDSPEWKLAENAIVVFRLGEHYVSTQSVDVSSRTIVLRSHPASAYTNIEMQMGKQIADFPFTDFEGKERRFSEFRGKYVLLDFWATWCGPCIAQIPLLKSAYERFKERGLEILGIDNSEDLDAAKKLVKEKGVTWPQATFESIKDRLRVYAFPTHILVDPDGKIISMGSKDELSGTNLAETLEKMLPARRKDPDREAGTDKNRNHVVRI